MLYSGLIFITIFLFMVQSIYSSQLKYVWGDAMEDPLASGPDGDGYPWDIASKIAARQRNPRSFEFGNGETKAQGLLSPQETRKLLLDGFRSLEGNEEKYSMSMLSAARAGQSPTSKLGQETSHKSSRQGRDNKDVGGDENGGNEGCVPSRLCPSTYNTTAPLYGISLTSGKPVTIVQKFPDLLQQVVFQVCKTETCEVLQGECIQSYLPYLFLVIPLGPVTLTGQDYILIESGCVCQPKYAKKYEAPPPLPFPQSQLRT